MQHDWSFWKEQPIQEIAWTTRRGYEAILALITNIGVNKTRLEWYEPGDSPFYAAFLDQGVEVKVSRSIMYRVTDVPAALREVQTTATGSFTLRVLDSVVPENEGPWRVSFSPSGVLWRLAMRRPWRCRFSVHSGSIGGTEPRRLGPERVVHAKSEADLEGAKSLLPPRPGLLHGILLEGGVAPKPRDVVTSGGASARRGFGGCGQDHRAFHRILQLANIPRPLILLQKRARIIADLK